MGHNLGPRSTSKEIHKKNSNLAKKKTMEAVIYEIISKMKSQQLKSSTPRRSSWKTSYFSLKNP